MWIKVRTPELRRNISIPIPLGLAGAAVSLVPERVLAQSRDSMPEEMQYMLTKPFLRQVLRALRQSLRGYKGLEIVHVESTGGEVVSITL
ncbi:MAG: hypothetical protein K2F83_01095 [Oscillospiraceae bacterium]|nr:hypothetical protein [Oscillospiraceae bacterium]